MEILPSEKLVLGICFVIAVLVSLVLLQPGRTAFLGNFKCEVFASITLIIGTILGAFFGAKG